MLVKNRFAADFEFFNRIGPTAAIRSQWETCSIADVGNMPGHAGVYLEHLGPTRVRLW